MADNIEIIAEVYLNYPYDESLNLLINLISSWGLFLLESNTSSQKAKIAIPSKRFKNLFGKNPKVGMETTIKEIENHIKKIKVIEIKVRRENVGKNKKSK